MKDGAPAGGGGHGLPVVRVRKYGNRRMYDLERKQYVALDEVARLVRDGRAVRVEDVSTGEDVTRATLVQALVEARGLARFLSDGAVVGLLRLDDARLGEVLGGELERRLSERALSDARASEKDASRAPGIAHAAESSGGDHPRVSQMGKPEGAEPWDFSRSSPEGAVGKRIGTRLAENVVPDLGNSVDVTVSVRGEHAEGSATGVQASRREVERSVPEPRWPAPVWPAPGAVGFGQGPPAGVYGAQPASSPQGLSEEVRSLRGEIDALRALLERAVRGGK